MNKKLRKYLVTAAIGLAMAVGLLVGRGYFEAPDQQTALQILCDSFFIPGVLLTSVGLLVFAANDGLFDMINYGVIKVMRLVLSEKKQAAYPKTYFDYKVMKHGTRKGGVGFILVVGLVFIALAGVFLVLYVHA